MPTEPTDAELRGEVVYFHAFDVANEIRLDRAGERLSGRSAPFTARPHRPAPRAIPVARPLGVEPPTPTEHVNGSPVRLFVRIFDVGVVSVTVRVAFAVESLTALVPFHKPTIDER